ncbi:hypothetical protein [Spirosoma utsteinense]|uniref:Outer membrane protein beta-barrel domain-containing protein n=1 Tax=Spirosoma utsteinense TaxID=2585773 RepID=A0ABR6WDQ0_9BACT|nr:hypothetical protein [Spirosoma utsteinense]MBC3794661.1 hypothetical protein [Spirosoma utsteinense]
MTKSFAFFWALALLFLTTTVSYAQKADQHKYWLGVGLGKSQYHSGMLALGYEFVNKPTLLIARYTDNRELNSKNAPSIIAQEFALLYGIKTGKFRFSTGVSNVWGRNRGKYLSVIGEPFLYGEHWYESVRYSTVGLPAEVRFITSTKDVGIGLTAFGNLNAKRSFVGLNLSLYYGKMK